MATPTTLPATFVAGDVLTAAQMNNLRGAFRVLQVVSTAKTDSFYQASLAVAASVDITGLSATITPSSTSSKILVFATVTGGAEVTGHAIGTQVPIKLVRGSTDICIGDAAGSRARISSASGGVWDTTGDTAVASSSIMFLDSPATTSATTYKITIVNATGDNGTMNVGINRGFLDTDLSRTPRSASTITLMEISA